MIQIPLYLLVSIFLGYTLLPVPKAIANLLETSQIFKFIVLVLSLYALTHPLPVINTRNEQIEAVLWIGLLLSVFALWRLYDQDVALGQKTTVVVNP